MHLTKNGITIQIDDAEAVKLVLERLDGAAAPASPRGMSVPHVGERWPGQGGIYAGIARGRNGEPDYCLIVGEVIGPASWDKAVASAADIHDEGHNDFTLPFRAEQALQFANVPELFLNEWYWSCEQRAEDAGYAWGQAFGYGDQLISHKDDEFRARAVRRLTIR